MVVLRESGEVESDEPIEESSFEELNSSYSPPPTTHSPPRGPANFPDFPPSPTYFPVSPTSFPPSPPYFPASSPPPSSSTSSRVGVRTGLALEDRHLTLFVEYQIEERGGELNVINGLEGGLEGSALNVINELEGGALNVINGFDAYEELLDEYDELEHQHEDIVDQLVFEHVGVDHRVMGYRGGHGQLRSISAGRVSMVNGVEYRQGQALSTTSEPSVEFEAKLSVRLWLGDRGQWVIDIHYGWKWLNLGTFRTTEGAPLAAESVGRRRGGKDLFDYPRPFLIENGSEPLQLLPTAQEENQDNGIGCEETEDCAVADQAQFNFGCLEKGITREKNPGEERRNKKANGVRIAIPLDDILQAKEMCLKDAANHLKVSTSELKSSCREHGIPKWPPRNEHKLIRQSLPKETPAVVNQMGIPQLTSHIVPSNQALTATIDTNSVVEKKIPPPQFLPTAQQENFDVGFGNDEVEAIGVGVEGTWEAVMEEAQLNSGGFGNDEAGTIGVGIEGTWEAVMEEAQLNSGGFDNDEAETIGVGIEGTLEAVMEEAQLNSRGFGNDKAKTIGVGIEGTSEAVMEEAQLNSGCSGKKRKRKVNTPGGESGNNITTGVRITIPKEDILQTKGMRIGDAAKHLEVSKSTLKRICRGYGIDRWPPRKEQELINQSRPNKSPAVVDQEQIPQLNPDTLLPSNQVPANSDKYSVKVKCGEGTIIKFRLSSPWRKVELEQEVKKRLPFEAGTYDIKYRDEDDELILISCDEDLVECISSSSAVGSRSIELFLKLK